MNCNDIYVTACINRGIKQIAIQMQQQPSQGARMNLTPWPSNRSQYSTMIALAQGRDRHKPIANGNAFSKNKTSSLYQKMLVTEKMFYINNVMACYSKN